MEAGATLQLWAERQHQPAAGAQTLSFCSSCPQRGLKPPTQSAGKLLEEPLPSTPAGQHHRPQEPFAPRETEGAVTEGR